MSLVPGEDAVDVRRAIDRVIERGWFVLGPEVSAFEEEFAAAAGAAHAVGVGSGTDAIEPGAAGSRTRPRRRGGNASEHMRADRRGDRADRSYAGPRRR